MWLTLSLALAYETDPVTGRDVLLADANATASARLDLLLDQAAARTNLLFECEAPLDATRRELARQLHAVTSGPTYVSGRGLIPGFGHSDYSAFLETSPAIERLGARQRSGIYADVSTLRAPVLALAGTASIVRVGDVRVGTDKLYHFLDEGFVYFRESGWGRKPEAALRWGHRAEQTVYGRLTSDAYSYADLEANWAGYRFYSSLLSEDSVLQLDPWGCVARVADWDWSGWVEPSWDELRNPPAYTRHVEKRVQLAVADTSCADADEPDLGQPSTSLRTAARRDPYEACR